MQELWEKSMISTVKKEEMLQIAVRMENQPIGADMFKIKYWRCYEG